ncbi:hypothetical protein QWM81_16905 [Streptomyces ficellus]|uniref:Uncharacterized protein n=1 Tax=Streptomyces ficellus TaxID=1977088 RepID=A0ABT7Z869_9ACTN|nr:hypothetical protein [Streptomyces ficellus]MDN3295699.1 hypothetical protein [Streptomyces ficellus]
MTAGGTFTGIAAGAVAAPVPAPGTDPLRGMPRALALSVPRGVNGDAPLPPLPDQTGGGRISRPSRRIPYAQGAPRRGRQGTTSPPRCRSRSTRPGTGW